VGDREKVIKAMIVPSSSSGVSVPVSPVSPLLRRTSMSPSRRRRRASPEWEGRDIITVAALPGRGLYVRHLGHPEGVDGVHRPTVATPGSAPRPAAAFETGWLRHHLDNRPEAPQIVHVHGLPARLTPEQVLQAADVVRAAGRPLVVTVYHLHDPSGVDDEAFAAQLTALLPRADAVITLTETAREEIEKRWSVRACVLPHPHVVDFVRMRRARAEQRRGPFLIGAHLGGLRLPGDPVPVVRAIATAVADVPDARLDVHVHDHLLDPDSTRFDPAAIREIERIVTGAGGRLRAHRPMTDAVLWDHLFGLDASFVPPVYGSHSIWPEACYDLGTQAILPGGSHAAQQRPGLTYTASPEGVPEAGSLHRAFAAARRRETGERADPATRCQERIGISETLRALYEKLLAGRI
jgi:beta-1,4-mannosyltransferase